MFTGLIQSVGRVRSAENDGSGGRTLKIAAGNLAVEPRIGDSIAVNGACLTVIEFGADWFCADVSTETLSLTTLGALQPNAKVNLERAMRPSDRLGGHMVSGHVDGVGAVVSVHQDARAQRWRFRAPQPLLRYIAKKGSICVDGVSLTVNEADSEGFEVALIPHTVENTAFSATGVGSPVNLEIDLVARYVERLLGERQTGGAA
jgi:riboflavin synthase